MMENRSPKVLWPNFFIVGAIRAGTTSLHRYLDAQPLVYMSPVKEPCFFSTTQSTRVIHEESAYLKLFQGATIELARGEASTAYLEDPGTPKRIHEVIPDARIVISLRDPIERALSHWFAYRTWNKRKLGGTSSFTEAVKVSINDPTKMKRYIAISLYSEQVKRYLDIFGPDQVKITFFEEFVNDIQRELGSILFFLGIPKDTYVEPNTKMHNRSNREIPKNRVASHIQSSKLLRKFSPLLPRGTKKYFRRNLVKKLVKPELELSDRRMLEEFYQDDMRKLSSILDRKLPWNWVYSN